MSLLIIFICLVSGYFYGAFSSQPKYVYGYDMTDNSVLRMNRKTKAVEFILWKKGELIWTRRGTYLDKIGAIATYHDKEIFNYNDIFT